MLSGGARLVRIEVPAETARGRDEEVAAVESRLAELRADFDLQSSERREKEQRERREQQQIAQPWKWTFL